MRKSPKGPTRKLTDSQEEQAVRMYLETPNAIHVAKKFGVHAVTLRKILRRRNVQVRSPRPRLELAPESIAQAVAMHKDGCSLQEIAKALSSSSPTISRVLTAAGMILARKACGPRHGNWRGGRNASGPYCLVLLPADSPYELMANRAGYVLEHRLVMARHLGRVLRSEETVHHIDCNPKNNDISNLQLRQGKHGKGATFCCGECGSRNIVSVPLD
jgi:hypothetical protein